MDKETTKTKKQPKRIYLVSENIKEYKVLYSLGSKTQDPKGVCRFFYVIILNEPRGPQRS